MLLQFRDNEMKDDHGYILYVNAVQYKAFALDDQTKPSLTNMPVASRKNDWGATIGIGMQTPICGKDIRLDLRYDMSLAEIANVLAERGELIPAGYPVVTIVDLSDVWVTFNLREDLLAVIKKGSIIPARFPALGMKEVQLKVTYINVLGDFATWNATKTRGDFWSGSIFSPGKLDVLFVSGQGSASDSGRHGPDPALGQKLLLGNGERADVIIDFSKVAPGTVLTLMNNAPGPYPTEAPVTPGTTEKWQLINTTMDAYPMHMHLVQFHW